jgi:hypothetical protein
MRPAGTMHFELEVSKLVWTVSVEQERRWNGKAWKLRGRAAKVLVQEAMA